MPVVRNGSEGSRSASRRRWVWGMLIKGQHEGHFLNYFKNIYLFGCFRS